MKQNKETLKKFFETGDKPTQQQYADLIDSYIDAKQPEGEANRKFVIDEKGNVNIEKEENGSGATLQKVSDNGSSTTNKLSIVNEFDSNGKLDLDHNEIALLNSTQNTFLLQQRVALIDNQEKLHFDLNNGSLNQTHQTNTGSSSISLNFPTDELKNAPEGKRNVIKIPLKSGVIATINDIPQYRAGTNVVIDNSNPLEPVINATGTGGTATNLSYDASTRTLSSSSGADVVLPMADSTNPGLMKSNFYAEGTFTPTLVDGGGGATYSSSALGKYTRLGNLVHYEISIGLINTIGTPNGDLKITGLPLPDSGSYSSISHGFDGVLGVAPPAQDAVSNCFRLSNNVIEFLYKDSSGNLSHINSALISNGTIRISGQYITNVYTP